MADDKSLIVRQVEDILSRYGDQIVTYIKDELSHKNKMATGNLYNSVQFNVQVNDSLVTLEILANDYFRFVDLGRTPGAKQPPIDKIIQWINIRGIRPRGVPDSKHKLPETVQSLAYAIAASIRKNGIPPVNALGNALVESKNSLIIDVGKVIASTTKQLMGKAIEDAAKELGNNAVTVKINY